MTVATKKGGARGILVMLCVTVGVFAACAPPRAGAAVDRFAAPPTRAEFSGYTETSRHADVVAFLDSLRALGAPLPVGSIGRSAGGLDIPFVIVSRPFVRTPEEARALGRPVVYVQGNIHGGEVEGKEALQMLLRDLVLEQGANVLDSLVLIVVPIYNADGNEALGPQERNRPSQNGPALVGRRPNGDGLDLNRDYMKAVAPETRASLAAFNAWDPDVFVDLHTTNGSFHGYALTYSPPLNPASPLEDYTRELLETVRQRMRARHGIEAFEYGNFGTDDTPWQERAIYTPAVHAWTTFDSRPRFSTNYYGLRGGVAVLAEAYSHDPFESRVRATLLFVRELLSLLAERGSEVQERRAAGAARLPREAPGVQLPIRARLSLPDSQAVLVEIVERTEETGRAEPGLPPGITRTGRFVPVEMPLFTRFRGEQLTRPTLGYLVPGGSITVLEQLAAHGILSEPLGDRGIRAAEFVVDSVHRAEREFEGRREVRAFGSWRAARGLASAGDWFVPVAQPLGRLAVYLLEPESDDGLVNWNFFGTELAAGTPYPILSVLEMTSN